MNYMFSYCENLNQSFNNWDVSNVTNMYEMFNNCKKMNKNNALFYYRS
jgi:surface protein